MRRPTKPFRKSHRWGALLLAFALLITLVGPVRSQSLAEGTPLIPSNSYQPDVWAEIKLTLTYAKQQDQHLPLSGATIRLVRVADLIQDGGGLRYQLRPGLESFAFDFTHMTSSEFREAASQLSTYLQSHPDVLESLKNETNPKVNPKDPNHKATPAVATQTSNSDGLIHFTNLFHGLYLITQVDKTGTAARFEDLTPFLVFAPEYLKNDQGGLTWLYVIDAKPKNSPTEPPDESSESSGSSESSESSTSSEFSESSESYESSESQPQSSESSTPGTTPGTGDDTPLQLWVGALAVALILLIFLAFRKKDQK